MSNSKKAADMLREVVRDYGTREEPTRGLSIRKIDAPWKRKVEEVINMLDSEGR